METVPLELPAELVKLAQLDTDNLSHETAKVLALDLFRERKISLGRAAELCETPPAAFMDFAAAHGVPPLSYDLEDLEHDWSAISKLRPLKLSPIPRRSLRLPKISQLEILPRVYRSILITAEVYGEVAVASAGLASAAETTMDHL